jgi:hypothetical protein
MRAAAGVDVVSDNAAEISVWPSTTSPQRHKETQLACTQGQRRARRVVRDNVDTVGQRPDDRVMQQIFCHPKYQGGEQSTHTAASANGCIGNRSCHRHRYRRAWARHHTDESGRFTETLVIEPITVTTLCEAVTWLAEQANITRATRAGQRYGPGLMTTLTPDMKLQSDFRADGAAEFDVGRLRRQLAKAEARLKEFERGAATG